MGVNRMAGGVGSVSRSRSRMEVSRNDDSNLDPLYRAVLSGNIDTVRNIIAKGNVNPNVINKEGNTPLHLSIILDYQDISSLLISYIKVSINAKNDNGLTPLHLAVQKKNLDTVKILVQNARVDANAKDNEENTPLHLSVVLGYKDILSFLISMEKVNLSMRNNNGLTPLHYAVLNGDNDVVKSLVYNQRINTNVQDKNGNTPLHYAAQIDNKSIIYFLIDQAKIDPNIKNTDGKTPLHIIAEHSSLSVLQYCLEQKKFDTTILDNDNKTPLDTIPEDSVIKVGPLIDDISTNSSMSEFKKSKQENNINLDPDSNIIKTIAFYAVQNDRLDIIDYLIQELQLKPTIKDSLGNSLLHQAIIYNKIHTGSKMIELYKLEVNSQNNDGRTPLHYASEHGYLDTVRKLVGMEADVNIQDNDGDTPPHLAAKNSFLNVVEFFINLEHPEITDKNDVDPNIQNNNGITLLHLAVELNNQDLVTSLVEEKDANTNIKDNDGNTPAHYAAQNRNLDILTYLQKYNSDLNTKNKDGQTPVCILTTKCTFDSHKVLPYRKSQKALNVDLITAAGEGNLSKVKSLILKGADMNYIGNVWRVLHAAASSGNLHLVKYLIEEKKYNNIDQRDSFYGGTPLNVAARYGHMDIVRYLVNRGANVNMQQILANQNTPAHEAAIRNDLVMLNYLKNEGKADLNIKNRVGNTPTDCLSTASKAKFLEQQVNHSRKRRDIVATTNALKSDIQNGFINLIQDDPAEVPMQISSQEYNSTGAPEINTNVVNNTVILGILTANLLNKTQYKQPTPEELLPPIEQSIKRNNLDGVLQNLSEGVRQLGGDSLNRKRRDIPEDQSVSWSSSIKDNFVSLVDSFVSLLVGDSKYTMTFQENNSISNKLSLSTLSAKLQNETQSKQPKLDKEDLSQLVDRSIQKHNVNDVEHNLRGRIKNMNRKNNPGTHFDNVLVYGNTTKLKERI